MYVLEFKCVCGRINKETLLQGWALRIGQGVGREKADAWEVDLSPLQAGCLGQQAVRSCPGCNQGTGLPSKGSDHPYMGGRRTLGLRG